MLNSEKVNVKELTQEQLVSVLEQILEYLDLSVYKEETPDYTNIHLKPNPRFGYKYDNQ